MHIFPNGIFPAQSRVGKINGTFFHLQACLKERRCIDWLRSRHPILLLPQTANLSSLLKGGISSFTSLKWTRHTFVRNIPPAINPDGYEWHFKIFVLSLPDQQHELHPGFNVSLNKRQPNWSVYSGLIIARREIPLGYLWLYPGLMHRFAVMPHSIYTEVMVLHDSLTINIP